MDLQMVVRKNIWNSIKNKGWLIVYGLKDICEVGHNFLKFLNRIVIRGDMNVYRLEMVISVKIGWKKKKTCNMLLGQYI